MKQDDKDNSNSNLNSNNSIDLLEFYKTVDLTIRRVFHLSNDYPNSTQDNRYQISKERARAALKELVYCMNSTCRAGEALTDIVSAIRGPDSDDQYLKRKSTAIIRHLIGITPYNGLVINDEDKMIDLDNLRDVNDHFIRHIYTAVSGLAKLELIPRCYRDT